ncbi:MAG: hypothetical protein CME25_18250 [Gemmatimonadetes bacterium]|nr:hypothetical protein [Gemmatimonadota bacterium]
MKNIRLRIAAILKVILCMSSPCLGADYGFLSERTLLANYNNEIGKQGRRVDLESSGDRQRRRP